GSVDAFALVTPGQGVNFQWRPAQDASATSAGSVSLSAAAPYWVKLVRAGSTFTAYASPDGQNWTMLGSAVVPMSTQVYVGLAVSARKNSVLNQSTFDYVSVTQAIATGYLGIAAGGGVAGTYHADEFVSGGHTAKTTHPIDLSGVTDPAPMAV